VAKCCSRAMLTLTRENSGKPSAASEIGYAPFPGESTGWDRECCNVEVLECWSVSMRPCTSINDGPPCAARSLTRNGEAPSHFDRSSPSFAVTSDGRFGTGGGSYFRPTRSGRLLLLLPTGVPTARTL